MSDEIDPLVIQRTQQKLGKYVQRPQLTDKLLRRPPFRFLHDIITAVINQYGVLENVFTKQELVSENIKEKDEKIAFLQKFISHLSTELGQDLNVKPSKIVAGIEAERTNDLLQALALILENKHNSKSQHKNTIAHESKSNGVNTPTKATGKSNNSVNSKQPTVIKKSIPTSKENTSKTIVKSEAKQASVKTRENAKAAGVGLKQTSSSNKTAQVSKVTTKNEDTKVNKEHAGASSSKKPDNINKPLKQAPSSVTAKTISRNPKETSPASHALDKLQSNREAIFDEGPADIPPDFSNVSEEPVKDTATLPIDLGSDEKSEITPDFPSVDSGITVEHQETGPLNNKSQPMKSSTAQDEGLGVEDTTDTRESSGNLSNRIVQLTPPQSQNLNAFEKPLSERSSSPNMPHKRPPSENRPKSSRRPPSRTIRDRLSVIPQDSRPLSSQVPKVIIEGNLMSDDEEDRIVQAAVFDQTTADLSQAGADELLGGEQGKLVEQILSAQKEWDPTADMETSSINSSSSSAQVQHLKAMIQEMAQAALPLGQLIPLIHEDMEIVQQELQFWKKEADLLEEEYHREKTSINNGFEKLQTELDLLNREVLEHQEKLNMAKASVLRTEKDVSLVISNFGKKR